MSVGPHFARSTARIVLALMAVTVTLSWLWVLFLFPEGWRDRHGYNQLGAAILTSGLHWAVSLPLTVAHGSGVLSPWLPWLAYLAPITHVLASSINAPWCLPFFVFPSLAILVVGFMEARRTVQGESIEDRAGMLGEEQSGSASRVDP